MKKTFAFFGLLALLSMAACGRKQTCPAYGQVPVKTQQAGVRA